MPKRCAPCPAGVGEPLPDLAALVAAVAQARAAVTSAIAPLTAARLAYEAQVAALTPAREAAFVHLDAAEAALRQATLTSYQATGNKHPHPAAGVRVVTRLVYDRAAVTTYARTHLTQVLILDTKAFERIAATLHVPGVVVVEEVQTTICQDLQSYLPEAGSAPVPLAGVAA